MRSSALLGGLVFVLTACGASGGLESGSPETAAIESAVSADTTAAPSPAVEQPEYDVFLAAVAETVMGTDYEGVPFDSPELTVATGLLLCERLAGGAETDEVVLEYLSELTDGDVTQADDDQLTLTGALIGAATEALCPELTSDE